jgi:hypothetical protein
MRVVAIRRSRSNETMEIEVLFGAVVTFVVVVGEDEQDRSLGIDEGGRQADSYPIVPASSVASGDVAAIAELLVGP